MRIAVLIIGLMVSVWTFFEAFALSFLDTNNMLAADDADSGNAAGGGLLVALVGALAASLAIAFPLASTILFGLAGLISIATAASGYGNHWVYGPIFILLSVMAFFGWRGKRQERKTFQVERQRQLDHEDRIETLLRQQRDQVRYPVERQAVTFPNFCPSCRSRNSDDARFCAECGAALTPTPTPPVTAPQ